MTAVGMECPKCGSRQSNVKDFRPTARGIGTIRRRRQCVQCGERYVTYEVRGDAFAVIRKFDVDSIEEMTRRIVNAIVETGKLFDDD